MCAMKRYILQRPVVRKSISFPGLTKNSNQTSQQLVYTLGNISSIVLSGLLSDYVGAGGAVGSMPPMQGWFQAVSRNADGVPKSPGRN